MENKEQKEFAYNVYGVRIVKCCASCELGEYCDFSIERPKRLCLNGRGIRSIGDVCKDWRMEEKKRKGSKASLMTMQALGNAKVKSPSYIKFIREKLTKLDIELNNNVTISAAEAAQIFRKRVQEWKEEYEHKFGSRYYG